MKIIDSHMHYWKDIKWFPKGFQWDIAVEGAKATWPYTDPNEVLESGAIGSKNFLPIYPDGKGTIKDAEDAGIDVSVILPLDWGIAYPEDSEIPIEQINKDCCDMAKKFPGKVYSYCGVDPRRRGAVKIFEKAVTEWGAKGLKLYPPCGFYPNQPEVYPLYQKAMELGVPVLIHTGYTFDSTLRSKTADPIYVEDVACDFPDLNIIIAHTGIQTLSSTAWWENAMGITRSKHNVHLDLAAWNETISGLTFDIPKLIRMLRVECDIVGAHRVLFGTDLPGYKLPGDREESLKFVKILRNLVKVGKEHGAVFSQEEVELIAHGNAERLLGI